MLAEVIHFISPGSWPMAYAPKDSPTSAFRSMRAMEWRQCTNKRAPRYCDALLLRLSGSPSNLRRPAVIRQAIRPSIRQRVCPQKCSEIRRFRWAAVDFDHEGVIEITKALVVAVRRSQSTPRRPPQQILASSSVD